MAAILNFGSGTMSGNVRSDIFRSGMVDNVRIAVGIATPSLAIQKLFPLPVSLAAILKFGSLPSSINVDQRLPMSAMSSMSSQSRPWSKIWRQPLESHRNLLPLESYFQFRFGGRHLESVVNNVGRHRHCHTQVGRGKKHGGSRWNYVSM